MEKIITNARIVLEDEVVHGAIVVEDGLVKHIDSAPVAAPQAEDFGGDYLLPGLVELHTDNLEKQLEPRPGIFWPAPLASVLAHDTQMVGAGVTTVLDAVSLGEYHDGPKRSKILGMSLDAIAQARAAGILRAEHFIHLRCEYSDPNVLAMFTPHMDDPHLRLVSLMDHTPGQRQFTDPAQYRKYFAKHNWSDDEFQELSSQLLDTQQACAAGNRQRIVELCRERNVPLASHDDTVPEHIALAQAEGVRISEFPTTLEAAKLARAAGLRIIMGAPNVVRNGSHSGNVSARTLAREGLLDILSSDYAPSSLVTAAFVLHFELGMPLYETVATISATPAKEAGLADRGVIRCGLPANLVRVRLVEELPVVLDTFIGNNTEPFVTQKSSQGNKSAVAA